MHRLPRLPFELSFVCAMQCRHERRAASQVRGRGKPSSDAFALQQWLLPTRVLHASKRSQCPCCSWATQVLQVKIPKKESRQPTGGRAIEVA